MSIEDIEAKLALAREYREVELAIDHCTRGAAAEGTRISAIVAEDAAEAERSVRITFTPEESAAIFAAAGTVLAARLARIKVEIG